MTAREVYRYCRANQRAHARASELVARYRGRPGDALENDAALASLRRSERVLLSRLSAVVRSAIRKP